MFSLKKQASVGLVEEILQILPSIKELRHAIHRHPEVGFEEVETGKRLAEALGKAKVGPVRVMGKTGMVYDIRGTKKNAEKKEDFVVCFRADMDALPMKEDNPHLKYESSNVGVAHMCGHDGHMACLVGFALILSQHLHEIPENCVTRLLFQPAEEGPGGAVPMIEEGCLDGVNEIYGMHNWPGVKLGQMAVVKGPMMAHVGEFGIEILGKGGHGATPHHTSDPVVCAAAITMALQSVVARNLSPLANGVLSVTGIHTGERFNIIPSVAKLFGTTRDLDAKVGKLMQERIGKIVESTSLAYGCTGKVVWQSVSSEYPVLINHDKETDNVMEAMTRCKGLSHTTDTLPCLGAEDFAFFLEKVPGCFFFMGTGEEENPPSCHSNHYDFNDKVIPHAIEMWLRLIEHRFSTKFETKQ